jgi:hypothetical protein
MPSHGWPWDSHEKEKEKIISFSFFIFFFCLHIPPTPSKSRPTNDRVVCVYAEHTCSSCLSTLRKHLKLFAEDNCLRVENGYVEVLWFHILFRVN